MYKTMLAILLIGAGSSVNTLKTEGPTKEQMDECIKALQRIAASLEATTSLSYSALGEEVATPNAPAV